MAFVDRLIDKGGHMLSEETLLMGGSRVLEVHQTLLHLGGLNDYYSQIGICFLGIKILILNDYHGGLLLRGYQ